MSRIRTIKPEFWTSEQILSCSPYARLLFIGLWNFCDDNGVHPASYVRLKAEIFPADNFKIDEIKGWVNELILNRLVAQYQVEDIAYWIVTGWKKHQRIDRPTYRHPLPSFDFNKIKDDSSNNPRDFGDSSTTNFRMVEESSTTDRNGMDRKGKEEKICEVETSPVCVSTSKSSTTTQEIFSHWQSVMNHPRAKLDKKRESKISQALKLGYGVEELKQAINGCSKTPYNMGKNDSGQRFDDVSLILRDAEHIERFINNSIVAPCNTKGSSMAVDLMAGVI